MTEFYVNIPRTTKGHACTIGPTLGGMTSEWSGTMAVSTYENQTGWWAEVTVHGRQMLGRGHSQETALYDLAQKVDALYFDLLGLRTEISRKASEAMENGL